MADIFDDKNKVRSAFMKFGKIGDSISGTLIDIREMASGFPGQEDIKVKVYDINVEKGSFHDIDEKTKQPIGKPIELEKGEIYSVGGRATVEKRVGTEKVKIKVLMGMQRIKIGQKFALRFDDVIKSKQKGFSDTKVIGVYTEGIIDPDFVNPEGIEANEPNVGF